MENIQLLQKLGFTEYEARAYVSLAKLGPSSVREIVLDSKLPRNKTYEALQRLEEKQKVVSLPVSPKKYKITNPEIFKEEAKDIENSVTALIKLIEQPKVTAYKDLFWVLKGRKPLFEKFAIENKKAQKYIFSCSELNTPLYKNMRIIKERVESGVKVRFITPFEKKNSASYRNWLKTGAQIRVFDDKKFGLLPRITIIDGKQGRLTVGIPEVRREEDYVTLWTESKAFCHMLQNQFLTMWENSKPIEEFLTKPPNL